MIAALGNLINTDNVRHSMSQFSYEVGGKANLSVRRTVLEAGSDFSIVGWLAPSNFGLYQQKIITVQHEASNDTQWTLTMNNPGGTVAGASAHLRFLILTNASNYIYIDSEEIIDRNKPVHFACKWNGVNAAGLAMYLNGIKQTSTPVTNGTFTSAYSNAALRFSLGRMDAFMNKCNMRDVAFFNRELTDDEVLEIYRNSQVHDLSQVSSFSDCVAYWPLKTNLECQNNATYNLDVSQGISYALRRLNPDVNDNISFKKATINNGRYVAFGGLIRVSSTLAYWIGRSGTSHVLNGKIIKIAIHLDTGVVDAPVDIITDGTYDIRGGTAAVIDGKIFVFAARYNGGSDAFIDLNYWESTDGLAGESYGSRTPVTTTLPRFNFYGEVIAGAAGEYWVPSNESDGSSNYKVVLYHTTDNGASFSRVEVYSGSSKMVEPSVFKSGNNIIVLARRNDSPYGIYQIVSTDGGSNWSSPALTNLAGTGGASNCAMCLSDNDTLTVMVMDRSGSFIWCSRENSISGVTSDEASYNTLTRVAESYPTDSYGILGYPNILNLGNSNHLVTYSAELSSSVVDLYVGFGGIRLN